MAGRGRFTAAYPTPVEIVRRYWHPIDVIGGFLFRLFYLVA
jgi:cytochrome c oxidase subunit 3